MAPRSTPWGAYKKIAKRLRERIENGDLSPGSRLPTETALSSEFGVDRGVIRRALVLLEADGLIMTLPRVGHVVLGPGGDRPQYRYEVIAAVLRGRIERGELQPGTALPGESALVAQYAVACGTVRHALAVLEREGLLVTVHGKGRFVRQAGGTTQDV